MTRLFVDACEVPFSQSGFATIEEVVRHVQDNHLAPGCVIRQINVDGAPLALENLVCDTTGEGEWIQSRDRIQIVTGTIWEVAAQSVREAAIYLVRIEPAIPRLAAAFHGSPAPEESACLRELFEGLFWINMLLDRLESTFPTSSAGISLQDTMFHEQHGRLSSVVGRLIDLQERGQCVEIASLLESEILPLIPGWIRLFDDIAGKIERPQ